MGSSALSRPPPGWASRSRRCTPSPDASTASRNPSRSVEPCCGRRRTSTPGALCIRHAVSAGLLRPLRRYAADRIHLRPEGRSTLRFLGGSITATSAPASVRDPGPSKTQSPGRAAHPLAGALQNRGSVTRYINQCTSVNTQYTRTAAIQLIPGLSRHADQKPRHTYQGHRTRRAPGPMLAR